VVGSSANVAKEFLKYRMAPTRDEVKAAITKTGQVNLNKWLNKATHAK
jgi:origin recognition complex subunit 4